MKLDDFGTELKVYRENGHCFDFVRGSKCVMLGLEPNLEKHLKVHHIVVEISNLGTYSCV